MNPEPVSVARAMGADVVIAVDLGPDVVGRHLRTQPRAEESSGEVGEWIRKLQANLAAVLPGHSPAEPAMPSIVNVLTTSINIMQVRISRSRMAGDPADLIVTPKLAHFGLLDFHRGKEAIEEGRNAVERVAHHLPRLRYQAP